MTTYDYSAGVMQFDECWYRFGPDGAEFCDEADAFDAWDFEADIESTFYGQWRLSEIRAIKPGIGGKSPFEMLQSPFKDKVELYISQRWQDRINDRVQCEVNPPKEEQYERPVTI
jgi:hypothetical protein